MGLEVGESVVMAGQRHRCNCNNRRQEAPLGTCLARPFPHIHQGVVVRVILLVRGSGASRSVHRAGGGVNLYIVHRQYIVTHQQLSRHHDVGPITEWEAVRPSTLQLSLLHHQSHRRLRRLQLPLLLRWRWRM